MPTYQVDFSDDGYLGRSGTRQPPASLVASVISRVLLARRIRNHVRGDLMNHSQINVIIDWDRLTGVIACGPALGGKFILTEIKENK
jgi:hypothetical protein